MRHPQHAQPPAVANHRTKAADAPGGELRSARQHGRPDEQGEPVPGNQPGLVRERPFGRHHHRRGFRQGPGDLRDGVLRRQGHGGLVQRPQQVDGHGGIYRGRRGVQAISDLSCRWHHLVLGEYAHFFIFFVFVFVFLFLTTFVSCCAQQVRHPDHGGDILS